MKLALGTAQFGLDYGISNVRGKIPAGEAHRILDEAFKAGVSILDTAPAYGESESLIGAYAESAGVSPRVISKYIGDGTDIAESVQRSLGNLRMRSLYALLVHHYEDFQKDPSFWNNMRTLRDNGIVSKIGFSLYYPAQLHDMMARLTDVDIVQVPYSVLDRRFEPFLHTLKGHNIEVHVRSVFLQGLIFIDDTALRGQFSSAAKSIQALRHIAEEHHMTVADAALGFVIGSSPVHAAVTGVDSIGNLRQLVACARDEQRVASFRGAFDRCIVSDENILLPFCWTKDC